MSNKVSLKIGKRRGPRDRMIIGQFISLVLKGSVKTSKPKAKALKSFADRMLIRISQADDSFKMKELARHLKGNKKTKWFIENFKGIKTIPGSYVSIVYLGNRKGDNTAMYEVSIIDYKKIIKSKSKKMRVKKEVAETTDKKTD